MEVIFCFFFATEEGIVVTKSLPRLEKYELKAFSKSTE